MLAPISPMPTTGALPGYAEPAAAEPSRTETALTVAASQDAKDTDSGAQAGTDSGAGPQSDGTFGATVDAAFAQRAAREAEAAAEDQQAAESNSDPYAEQRQQAKDGYAEALNAMGMTE